MASHVKLPSLMTPAEKLARVAASASSAAHSALTRRSGTIYVPNGDGSGTVIGPGGGGGVTEWVGDKTAPGRPTGVSATSAWGVLYVSWDGTLEGGVPADFAYCSVMVDGTERAQLAQRGTAAIEGLAAGTTVTVTLVAYDDAHAADGTPAPNASAPSDPVTVIVSDERAEIDAEVDQARKDAAAAEDKAGQASDKADELSKKADEMAGQITDITVTQTELSTKVEGAVEDAGAALKASSEVTQTVSGLKVDVQQSLTDSSSALEKATSAEVTANGLSTKVTQALTDSSEALTKASEAKQTADGLEAKVTQSYENSEEALTKATEAKQTADGLSATISRDYVSKEDAGKTYATKAELTATSDSIRTEVSETYVTKEGADATYAAKSYVDQTADSITSNVSKTYVSKADASSTYATKTQLKQTSDSITSTVEDVKTVADSAYTKASSVEQTADGLTVRLTTAEGDIKDAQDAASSAQSTANSAKSTASAASSAASSASSKASAAQSAADKAQDAADSAQSTANSAKSTASSASSTANAAKTAASSAQSTANTAKSDAAAAKTAASNAAKTATNYLKFDSSGLCVGNMSGTLGYNALITGSAYQIRNGSTVLSSFGASAIELGRNSTAAVVRMCGGMANIAYSGGVLNMYNSSTSTCVQLSSREAYIAGSRTTTVGDTSSSTMETLIRGGSIYIGNKAGVGKPISNVFVGSKSCTNWDGNDVQVLSPSDIASLCGREYREGDTLLVANGDARANKSYTPVSAEYWSSSGWWAACGASGSGGGGNIRINYVLFAVA